MSIGFLPIAIFWGKVVLFCFGFIFTKKPFRFLFGVADSASYVAVVGIMMKLWPDKISQIISWTESIFSMGYTIGNKSKGLKWLFYMLYLSLGPALSAGLYATGGFELPFFVLGGLALIQAVLLVATVPSMYQKLWKILIILRVMSVIWHDKVFLRPGVVQMFYQHQKLARNVTKN